jgi:threonine dehydratase
MHWTMTDPYIDKILNANVYDVATKTPLTHAPSLSERLDCDVHLKREDLQPIFSFKCRGAYNKMSSLTDEERARGVVAASAGNHAQGVALAAQKLGVDATIVMPVTTPSIKVDAVKRRGANVVLQGDAFDQASEFASRLVAERGATYLHPFDDPDVIAGQGTVGLEVSRQLPSPADYVFIPCGGGGLLSGMAVFLKHVWPEVMVIGVEPADAACALAARQNSERVTLDSVGLFADGCAVARVGKETHRVIEQYVDDIITASTDEMCAAVKDIFEDTRAIAEPAGALAIAGMKTYLAEHDLTGKRVVAVLSGANTNFDRLRYISERTDIGERREAVLSVTIPEEPGAFRAFCRTIGKRNITEFNYRAGSDTDARVFVGLTVVPQSRDVSDLTGNLEHCGYSVVDLTDNEMAKLHVRHMIGGQLIANGSQEHVFRVEFPERPGALMTFLDALGSEFNISMFHYRNHGAAYGRILVGFTGAEGFGGRLIATLNGIGFRYWEETENPAYREYLKPVDL